MDMDATHVDSVVSIHMDAFQGFFLTFLGRPFLRLYYENICFYSGAIKLVSVLDGNICGFVVGVVNPAGFYKKLIKRDLIRFAIATLPALIKRPRILARLTRALNKPKQAIEGQNIAELTSIAVNGDCLNTGVGKSLVQKFEDEARSRGCNLIYLTTDSNDNDSVNAFYLRQGFSSSSSYVTHEGRHMNVYTKEI